MSSKQERGRRERRKEQKDKRGRGEEGKERGGCESYVQKAESTVA